MIDARLSRVVQITQSRVADVVEIEAAPQSR